MLTQECRAARDFDSVSGRGGEDIFHGGRFGRGRWWSERKSRLGEFTHKVFEAGELGFYEKNETQMN